MHRLPLSPPSDLQRFGRLLLAGNLAVFALLALTLALTLKNSRTVFTERAQQTTEGLARLLSARVAAEVKQIDNALLSTMRQLDRLEAHGALDLQEARRIADDQRALVPQVDALRFTDEEGRVLNGDAPSPVALADRDYFVQARAHPGLLSVSEPLQGRIIRKWGLIFARARTGADGSFRGIVYSNLSADHFSQVFADVGVGPRGAVTLRSATLRLIARYSPDSPTPEASLGSASISHELRDALARNPDQGFYESATLIDGVVRATAYRRVPGVPLLLLVGLAADEFYAPWRHEAIRTAALAALLQVLVISLSLLAYREHARQVQGQQRVAELAAEQQAMLDNELVGMVRLKDRKAVWHNRALAQLFRYGPGELQGQPSRLLYADDASYEEVGRSYDKLAAGQQARLQLRMQRKDGSLVWIDLSGMRLPGGESLWMMADISAVKESEAQARHMALHDPLTGLANRAQLQAALASLLDAAAMANDRAAVCFIDLDGFKAVNDQHGHEAGDLLLREAARRIAACVRGNDLVARLGGDEFVLVLSGLKSAAEVQPVLRRLLGTLSRPVDLGGGASAAVGASIGVALYPDHGREATSLLAAADEAMYEAKRAGKNRYALHGQG